MNDLEEYMNRKRKELEASSEKDTNTVISTEFRPGYILRKIREDKGLTQEDVSERTKIQVRYLQALENGDLDVFPGDIYLKGSLKSYARLLGLDGDAVLEEFGFEQNKEKEVPGGKAGKVKKDKMVYSRDDSIWGNLLTGVLIVLLVFVGLRVYDVYFGAEDGEQLEQGRPGEDNHGSPGPYPGNGQGEGPGGPGEDTGEDTGETIEETKEPGLVLVENPQEREFKLINTEDIQLVVNFSGRCWVRFIIDGEEVVEDTYGDGQEVRKLAGREIILRLGNPQVVRVRANGLEVDLGPTNRPVTLVLRRGEIPGEGDLPGEGPGETDQP